MATDPIDPTDELLDAAFEDPETQRRLAKLHDRVERAEAGRSHNEARRLVGLPPLPEFDLDR